MVYLQGITLTADDIGELHRFARQIVLSKSWYNLLPHPHYVILCPHKEERAFYLLDRQKRKYQEHL